MTGEKQALEIADALSLEELDSVAKLRNRAAFMASGGFSTDDHGWMAAAMTELASDLDEDFLLIHAEITRLTAALADAEARGRLAGLEEAAKHLDGRAADAKTLLDDPLVARTPERKGNDHA